MRQCLTLALIISMVHISLSQFRVKVGMTLSDLRLKENFYPKDLGFDRSVTLGLEYTFKISNLIGFETGLHLYSLENSGEYILDADRTYVGLPLVISFKPYSLISPGLGIMASMRAKGDSSDYLFKKTYDVSALAKITVKPFQHTAFDIGYSLGIVPFADLNYWDNKGRVLASEMLKNKFYFLRVSIDI